MSVRGDIREARRDVDTSSAADQGMAILAYLLAGMVCYGGLGWIVDHWWGTRFGLPVGLLFGTVVSCWVVIKRYGSAS